MCLPSARTHHAAQHTCSGTLTLHSIQLSAHLRPTFAATDHASAGRVSTVHSSDGARLLRVCRPTSTSQSCRRSWRWLRTTSPSSSGALCASACALFTVPPGSFPGGVESYLAEFLDGLPLRLGHRQAVHIFGGSGDDADAARRGRRRSRDRRRDSARAAPRRRRRGRRGGGEAARGDARAARGGPGALQRPAGSGPTAPGRGRERGGPPAPMRRVFRLCGTFVTLL